jgi:uncharacterized protein (TIGR02596 family)
MEKPPEARCHGKKGVGNPVRQNFQCRSAQLALRSSEVRATSPAGRAPDFPPMKNALKKSPSGFSLIELLVVCAILALVAGFTVPAASTALRGSQLTQGSQLLSDQIALARQTALTKNAAIEFRIYKFADPEIPGENPSNPATGKYRAFQTFEVLESGGAVPLGKIQRLPNTVIFNEKALSSVIERATADQAPMTGSPATDVTAPLLGGGVNQNYEWISFRFLPNGGTNLAPNDLWFLTLHGGSVDPISTIQVKDSKGAPINFFTLQIDPVSGTTKSYRPTAG